MVSSNVNSGTPSFEEHSRAVILALKGSLADLADALPVTLAAGPTELGRALQVDTKLAWKVTNLLEHVDPFEAGRFVPGALAMKRFLAAAEGRDVPKALIANARRSFERFEELVDEHAGTRSSLDMMLASQASGDSQSTDLEHRKAAFRANSYLWGVKARMQIKTVLFAPSIDDPDRVDVILINGFVDLQRIRRNAPWRISSAYSVDDHGEVHTGFDWSPLDPDLAVSSPTEGAPLVRAFCSKDLPDFNTLPSEAGAVHYAFREGPVGRHGSVNCVSGEVLRRAEPRYRDGPYETRATYLRLHTPCEVAIQDLIIHRDLFEKYEPQAHLFSGLYSGELLKQHLACDELPMRERVEALGTGSDCGWLPEMPGYRALLGFAFEQVDWNPRDFELQRVRMAYPPTPTALVIRQQLPDRPAGTK